MCRCSFLNVRTRLIILNCLAHRQSRFVSLYALSSPFHSRSCVPCSIRGQEILSHVVNRLLSPFVSVCLPLVTFCIRWSPICHLLYPFVSHLSPFVSVCLPFVTFCLRLSPFFTICLDLSRFVTVCLDLSRFVFVCLRLSPFVTFCLAGNYFAKWPLSNFGRLFPLLLLCRRRFRYKVPGTRCDNVSALVSDDLRLDDFWDLKSAKVQTKNYEIKGQRL
jgi:hypothetical protein